MKITDVRLVALSAPLPEPIPWLGGVFHGFDHAIVEVETEDGLVGLGEVTQATAAVTAVSSIVETMRPLVVGKRLSSAAALRDLLVRSTRFWARGGLPVGVISALEVAAWDLLAQEQHVPLWRLLGGLAHARVRAYASTGLGPTVAAVVEQVRAQQAAGFDLVKVRARPTVPETLELLDRVADVLLPGTRFALDGAQGTVARPWTFQEAVRIGRRLSALDAEWFEEPRPADDHAGYAELRRKVDVPLAGVETYTSRADFRALANSRGVDVLQPDATIVGGIGELNAVVTLAESHGLRVVPHTWGSAIAIMANYHAAFANPSIELVEFCTYDNPLMTRLLDGVLQIEGGSVAPSRAPGLGVGLPAEIRAEFANVRPGTGISVAV
ncbi:mandelate racemase/muconate lactonizing enzyme family protein [Amycolatopsis sp. NPDC005232]|uniref:mandelate racemase/muconate lactonizing enzyme family protein n=1 Tax=Amycolatopsis sp. NPDC005232 TaxID=3157027 RepID=UPI0033AC82AE